MKFSELTASEKIKKVKIQLQDEKPFFSYVLLHLSEREEKGIKTLAINKYGRMLYNPDYVNTLSFELLKSAICHEALHIVLKHFWRVERRDMQIFNISSDCAVNCILEDDRFELSDDWIRVNDNKELIIGGEVVSENANKKSAEEIYENIYDKLRNKGGGGKGGKGEGKKDQDGKGIPSPQDDHDYTSDEGKEQLGDGNNNDDNKVQNFWEDVLIEGSIIAKQRGKLPKGIERMVDKLINPKVNWRHLLHKAISSSIPFDYKWNRPSKKSYSTGIYFPQVYNENVDVLISIDTSGSIGQNELTEFLSENVGLAKSFNQINMTIIICDSEIKEVYEIKNGNIPKILSMKIKGGGGTSHIPVYEWIEKNKPKTKLLINFTDGYTEFPENPKIDTIWILPENSISKDRIPFGRVIKMKHKSEE